MAVTTFARRFRWYLHALGFNPLIRLSDRLEALAALAVLATALFAVPVVTQTGNEVYHTGVRTADEQSHSRHFVEAVAMEASSSTPADFGGPAYVPVQWHDGTRLRTERIITPETVTTGEHLKIWLDDSGKVVAAPLTEEGAKMSAFGAAGTLWLTILVFSGLVAFVIRRGLDRARDRAWERELHLLAHNDDGWANKHI